MVAVNSLVTSESSGNPAVKRIKLLRPGTPARFFARLRIASSRVYVLKEASEFCSVLGTPSVFSSSALMSREFGLLETFGLLMPETAFARRSASVVKFCTICRLPPKFITDIT